MTRLKRETKLAASGRPDFVPPCVGVVAALNIVVATCACGASDCMVGNPLSESLSAMLAVALLPSPSNPAWTPKGVDTPSSVVVGDGGCCCCCGSCFRDRQSRRLTNDGLHEDLIELLVAATSPLPWLLALAVAVLVVARWDEPVGEPEGMSEPELSFTARGEPACGDDGPVVLLRQRWLRGEEAPEPSAAAAARAALVVARLAAETAAQ